MAASTITAGSAIGISNKVIAAMQSVEGLVSNIKATVDSYTMNSAGGTLGAMATVALNPDGSFGAADAAPVAGNPIDPAKTAGPMTEVLSSYNLGAGISFLQSFLALCAGSTVPQVSNAPTLLKIFNP
jgi:hypothetical protein